MRKMFFFHLILTLLVVLLGGCFEPEYGPAPFSCRNTQTCPSGYQCIKQVCYRNGFQPVDAGADFPQDTNPIDQTVDRPVPDLMLPDLPLPDTIPPVPGIWILISKGTFQMGLVAEDPCASLYITNENRHEVTLTHDYLISETEVTQGQYREVTDQGSAATPEDELPVSSVTWHDAAGYCNGLSKIQHFDPCYECMNTNGSLRCAVFDTFNGSGHQTIYDCPGYRLPTEAEWERAYWAGTSSNNTYHDMIVQCWGGDQAAEEIGWYNVNSGQRQPVKQKLPNAWGLYDMAGNIAEWVHETYVAQLAQAVDPGTAPTEWHHSHAIRGGSSQEYSFFLRGSQRSIPRQASFSSQAVGFRCVRSLP